MATYYEILGVEMNASADSIRRAYRGKAKILHPDINSAPAAKARFQQINEAYQVLRNEKSRRSYDLRLRYGSPARRVYYQEAGTSSRDNERRYAYHPRSARQQPEPQTKLEKILDQFMYLFMLMAGLFALGLGIARLWAEPIYGVNPIIGITFGGLFTILLIWGWNTRSRGEE